MEPTVSRLTLRDVTHLGGCGPAVRIAAQSGRWRPEDEAVDELMTRLTRVPGLLEGVCARPVLSPVLLHALTRLPAAVWGDPQLWAEGTSDGEALAQLLSRDAVTLPVAEQLLAAALEARLEARPAEPAGASAADRVPLRPAAHALVRRALAELLQRSRGATCRPTGADLAACGDVIVRAIELDATLALDVLEALPEAWSWALDRSLLAPLLAVPDRGQRLRALRWFGTRPHPPAASGRATAGPGAPGRPV